MGDKFLLTRNMSGGSIEYKYREGKMKSTLKRELKVPEIADMEADKSGMQGEVTRA